MSKSTDYNSHSNIKSQLDSTIIYSVSPLFISQINCTSDWSRKTKTKTETWTCLDHFYIDPVSASALNCKQNLDTKTHNYTNLHVYLYIHTYICVNVGLWICKFSRNTAMTTTTSTTTIWAQGESKFFSNNLLASVVDILLNLVLAAALCLVSNLTLEYILICV